MEKDNIPSRPVGERFNFGGVVLEVVESATNDDCVGCYFYSRFCDIPYPGQIMCIRNCEKYVSFIGHCYYEDREDGEGVIFRQVEESEQK